MTWDGIIQRYRRWRLARRGLKLDRSCSVSGMLSLGPGDRVIRPGVLEVGPQCQLGFGVELAPWSGSIRIGRHVFIGPHSVVYGHGSVEIGDNSLIAMHCCIVSSNHQVPGSGRLIRAEPDILLPVKIGRDVWLGAGVKVLGGVTLGDGCVVGAGAVVTGDLPPYSISVGAPARVVRLRD